MVPIANSSRSQRIVMGVFFSVFLMAGCGFMYWMVVSPFLQSRAAHDWKETPCRVLSSEVKAHSSSDGTTYSVEISYAYQFQGHDHRSDRYQFLRCSSSGREPKAKTVARYPRGKQTHCFVNPLKPSEAVLDRSFASIGWFAVIPLVFMGVGAAGIFGAIRGGKNADAANTLKPDAAWQARPDWAAGRIVSSTKKALLFVGIFAVAWNAMAYFATWMVLSQHVIRKGNYAPALVFFFPLVGMGLLIWALRLALRRVRFGESIFEMTTVPGVIGGALEGVIRVGNPMRPEGPVRLQLKCLSRFTTKGGDNNTTKEAIVWQHEESVDMDGGDAIPVAFLIPADACQTTVIKSGDGILWRLEVKARVPGIDYTEQFEVPVFRGELSPVQRAEAARLQARDKAETAAYVHPPTSPIRVQMALDGGTEFDFAARRNLSASIPATIVLPIVLGLLGAAIQWHWPLPPTLFLALVSVLLSFAVIQAWTACTRVIVRREGVTVTNAILGIPRTRTVPAEEIVEIKPQFTSMQGESVFQDLHLICRDGKSLKAGKNIPDSREAEWLAAQMTQALRVR